MTIKTIIDKINAWNPEIDGAGELSGLLNEADELCKELQNSAAVNPPRVEDCVSMDALPAAKKYETIVDQYADYPLWGCDSDGNCVVNDEHSGEGFTTESINDIVDE